MSWFVPKIDARQGPCPRGGHCLATVGTSVVVFGGANREPRCFGDAWLLETGTSPAHWQQLKSTKPRTGASATVIGTCTYIIGGYDPVSGDGFNDVAVLDVATGEWSHPATKGEPPPPVHSHAACLLEEDSSSPKIVIFGGATEHGCTDAAFTLDAVSFTWSRVRFSGPTPSPREMHTLSRTSPTGCLLFGGRGAGGQVLNDLWLLHTARGGTLRWEALGGASEARCAHTATPAGHEPQSPLYIYGGFSGEDVDGLLLQLDPRTLKTTVLCDAMSAAQAAREIGAVCPPPRFAHGAAMLALGSATGASASPTWGLVVFGGVNPLEDLSDVVVWDPRRRGCLPEDVTGASTEGPVYLEEIT